MTFDKLADRYHSILQMPLTFHGPVSEDGGVVATMLDARKISRDTVKAALITSTCALEGGKQLATSEEMPCSEADSVCVLQGETGLVVCVGDRDISNIGSVDATTCLMVAACIHNDEGSVGAVMFAHLDTTASAEMFVYECLPLLYEKRKSSDAAQVSLFMVGSYWDESDSETQDSSEEVVLAFLRACACDTTIPFVVKQCCIWEWNTQQTLRRFDDSAADELCSVPCVYDVAFDIRAGCLRRAKFVNEGIYADVRGLRFLGDVDDAKPLHLAYCWPPKVSTTGKLVDGYMIEPYPLVPQAAIFAEWVLTLSDGELLRKCSTSWRAEPAHFAPRMRQKFEFLLKCVKGEGGWANAFAKT